MRSLLTTSSAVAVAAAVVIGGAYATESLDERQSGTLIGLLVCGVAFVVWPWAVLPTGIVGGVIATKIAGINDVTSVVLVHTGILAAGCAAVAVRHIASSTEQGRVRTCADGPMALFTALVAVAALFGLARGNAPYAVLVAAYEIAIIPAYFFVATFTLTSRRRLHAAGVAYIASAAALAAVELTMPGRHGGLLSVLAIPPLLVTASHVRGWRQAAAVALIALFVVDVIAAFYRAMWVALGLALLVLLVRGTTQIRRGVVLGGAAGCLLLATVSAVSPGLNNRITLLGQYLDYTGGYRLAEMSIGLHVFADHPFTGDGLGQTTPDVYLPDFTMTDVGPVYHVFWVMILANLGLIGLIAVLWPLWHVVRVGLRVRDGPALAAFALTCGFVASAAFAGPTDGHWELGLLPAITLLAAHLMPSQADSERVEVVGSDYRER